MDILDYDVGLKPKDKIIDRLTRALGADGAMAPGVVEAWSEAPTNIE